MSANHPTPVERPQKNFLKLVGEVLDHGGPGYLQFVTTNICGNREIPIRSQATQIRHPR
tara:strand:- start:4780 stop:4956 length:177 start_codon:yes stop_codon:yes gene_type:complete